MNIASQVMATIPTVISSADVLDVTNELSAAASLVNHVVVSADESEIGAKEDAEQLRADIVSIISKVVTVAADADSIESTTSTLEIITASSPESMKTDTQVKILGNVVDLIESSANLEDVPHDAASSSVCTLSNLIGAGIFTAPINPSSSPTPLPSLMPTAQPSEFPR